MNGRDAHFDSSNVGAALEDLLRPLCDAQGNQIAQFNTLSIPNQAAVLLAVRQAEPSPPAEIVDKLREAALAPCAPPLIRALAGGKLGDTAQCPSFLFTSAPAFPFAPQLLTPAEFELRAVAEAETEAAQRPAEALGEGLHLAEDTELEAAQAWIRSEFVEREGVAELSPEGTAALEVVLQRAAAAGTSHGGGLEVLAACGLCALSDEALHLALLAGVAVTSSSARCAVVARGMLLPTVKALTAPPTQSLTIAATHLGECNPQALLEHCLQPLMASPGDLTKHQAEFVLRALKQGALPKPLAHGLVDAAHAAGRACNEHAVAVLQGVVDARVPLTDSNVAAMVAAVGAAKGAGLGGSLKLQKLMLTAVKVYGGQMDGQTVESAAAIAHDIGPLSRAIQAALGALKV